MAGFGKKKRFRIKTKITKRSTAVSYFDASKRGDKKAMARFARQDSLEQRGIW